MPIPSQYPGTCKDCGKSYAKGDQIETNGKESPNQKGEIKAHWCKDGKNCQGAQQFNIKPVDVEKLVHTTKLSADSLRKILDANVADIHYGDTISIYIKVLKDCEVMGITEPPVIGMIFNNVIRRLQ